MIGALHSVEPLLTENGIPWFCGVKTTAGLCARPPHIALTTGCVHEHVSLCAICERHALGVRKLIEQACVVCMPCSEGKHRHMCYLTIARWEPWPPGE